jgi:hypothetical protein
LVATQAALVAVASVAVARAALAWFAAAGVVADVVVQNRGLGGVVVQAQGWRSGCAGHFFVTAWSLRAARRTVFMAL